MRKFVDFESKLLIATYNSLFTIDHSPLAILLYEFLLCYNSLSIKCSAYIAFACALKIRQNFYLLFCSTALRSMRSILGITCILLCADCSYILSTCLPAHQEYIFDFLLQDLQETDCNYKLFQAGDNRQWLMNLLSLIVHGLNKHIRPVSSSHYDVGSQLQCLLSLHASS